MFRRLRAFVRLGRPLFLGGGFAMYALGAALAKYSGAKVDWRRYAWGQLAVTAIQLMTHYANDYFDLAADRANKTPTAWSGGSRVLTEGLLPPVVALVAALALAAAGGGVAAHFALGRFAPAAAPLVLLMLALAWSYSAPPLRLCARGLGELTTAVVVTLLVPSLGFVLQKGVLTPQLPLGVISCCVFQFAMLLAIEFPDADGDAATGKRTLVVRWGGPWAARVYVGVIALSYLALPLWVALGLQPRIAIAASTLAPVAAWQIIRVAGGAWSDPERWESVGFWSVALLVATAVVEVLAALTA